MSLKKTFSANSRWLEFTQPFTNRTRRRRSESEVVHTYIRVNSDCDGIEEFSEAAILSSAYSQCLVLLSAEDAPVHDRQHTETALERTSCFPSRMEF